MAVVRCQFVTVVAVVVFRAIERNIVLVAGELVCRVEGAGGTTGHSRGASCGSELNNRRRRKRRSK